MNKRLKKKWLRALRSGHYRQVRSRYRAYKAHSALGVLLDAHDPRGWTNDASFGATQHRLIYSGSISSHGHDEMGISLEECEEIILMNDGKNACNMRSFKQIARWIEYHL